VSPAGANRLPASTPSHVFTNPSTQAARAVGGWNGELERRRLRIPETLSTTPSSHLNISDALRFVLRIMDSKHGFRMYCPYSSNHLCADQKSKRRHDDETGTLTIGYCVELLFLARWRSDLACRIPLSYLD
jgi:hypothetical protein